MGAFLQFIVEYVGNLHLSNGADEASPMTSTERRTNRHARDLIDWIEAQMEARGFEAGKKRELVHDLRHAFRQNGPTWGGVSANDGTSEGAAEWAPGTKGVSRDAPS